MLLPAAAFAGGTEEVIAPSDPKNPQVDSGWQAGTCDTEAPDPGASGAEVCSVDTPDWFFEQAAGHPHFGFTQFIVKFKEEVGGLKKPEAELARVRVDLPVGLNVNPGATERCPLATFEAGPAGCPAESNVGDSYVTAADPLIGLSIPLHAEVYNIVPVQGESARFGLNLAGNNVYLEGDADWSGNYHEGFTIEVPKVLPAALEGFILKNRLVFDGRAGDGTFITTPSTCLGEAFTESGSIYSTFLRAASYQQLENKPPYEDYVWPQSAEPPLESPIPPGTSPKECGSIPYDPSLAVDPGTSQTNSPAGATIDVDIPHLSLAENEQQTSTTKESKVTLPLGMGLNPSAANGLQVCTDAQFGKGTRNPVACPPGSRVGTATIDSPALPTKEDGEEEEAEGPALKGAVYVGEQLSRDPTSGNLYRIFINAVSERYGIDVRLIGNVSADPQTGQLTTTIADTPQSQVENFEVKLDGGARAVLSSPPTCGPNTTNSQLTPWSAQFSGKGPATPSSKFSLAAIPGGGPCPKTMASRPFSPGFGAAPASSKAGAFSPLTIRIARNDGQQELKGTDIVLPPGMTGKLRGIPYCSEAALVAAANRGGKEEAQSSSCPAASQVGTATVAAGTGPAPYSITGKVFLSGPYKGAPLSLAVVTPATAGPLDLGTVVVRVALFVDPETAQIRAVSDPIPHVFGGTLLSVRSVDLKMDRPDFTLNPTSCDPLATAGALNGGGADPANPATFSAFGISAPFQTSNCGALKFRPKLFTKLIGNRKKMRRNGHPAFQATLVAREGDANIKRAALTLPRSQFLDQSHIGTVCTRPQLATATCPARSVYGSAEAISPLLDEPLKGPVYLVSSDNVLPDLLADLKGQVNVRLRGVIDSKKRRMRTTFASVPDVPVSKFVLRMKGGKKGLLVNSRDLCKSRNLSFLNFKAQNGKRRKVKKLKLQTPACKGAKAGKGKAGKGNR
ncbi:MAG TPA: hypothetical protein VLI94_13995 [Solirubrobacterales bacterium]|nr:hypothetical protein [Solirubrobacterales bacterium]